MSRSLKNIFLRRLTMLAVCSALLLGVLLVRAQRAILLNDLANKGEAIARMLSAVTLDAVMVHDYATVERYVADIGDDPTIVSLSIRRADGEMLAYYEAAAPPKHVLPVSHPVTIGEERFGEVLIVFSTARVREISRNLLLATVAAVILFHFLGVAISNLALKKAVTAPLARLNHAIRTLRQGYLHQRIDIVEPVELAEIGASFNDMTATIRESFAKINRQRQDLQFEQAKLAAIVDNMADGLFVTDNDGVIIAFNHSAEAISGFAAGEALGKKCVDLYRTNLCRDACALHHAGETIRNRETTMKTRDGRLLQVTVSSALLFDAQGEAVGGVQTFRDITADKKRHEMYCHTEKLAAIGQLAAGVAHEINNPLGNIIGYARYIKPESPREEIERKTAVIIEQARKCSDIVQGLLHFSRSAGAEPGPFDLNELIRRTIDLARYQAARQLTVLTFTGREELTAFADPKKIEQVVFNLLNNALQAIKNQGQIRIESGRAGNNVYFSVTDDGPGIDEAIMPRIFDPFFTTKPVGEGTGLGLSICAGIVAEAAGSIDVESAAAGGTCFTVILPAAGAKKETP
jgi:two-component system NtrC family sensor kinase